MVSYKFVVKSIFLHKTVKKIQVSLVTVRHTAKFQI